MDTTEIGELVPAPVTKSQIKARIRDLPAFKKCKSRLQRRFLLAYSITGHIAQAAKLAGCDPRNNSWWKKKEEYVQALKEAKETAIDLLEGDMLYRSLYGYEEPIVYKGKITAYYRKFSAEERKFMLQGNRKEYSSNVQLIGNMGPIGISVRFGTDSMRVGDTGIEAAQTEPESR